MLCFRYNTFRHPCSKFGLHNPQETMTEPQSKNTFASFQKKKKITDIKGKK